MPFASRRRNEPEPVLRQMRHGHLAHDAAARGAEIAERRAAGARQGARNHMIDPGGSSCALDLELRKSRKLEERNGTGDRGTLTGNRAMPVRTAERALGAARVVGSRVVQGALPATAC